MGTSAGAGPALPLELDRRWRLRSRDELVPGRRIVRLLGGGDRFEAYLAWDDRLHALVVAKVLRPHLVDDAVARSRLVAEAEALARLHHPAIVRAFSAELSAGRPHLVLEFLDGPRLSTLLRRYGPLSAEQVIHLARQLCSAMHYLAAEGWLHLDVKPRNIVMTSSPRLIDLSVARDVAAARALRRPVGTAAYMAPEQCDPDRYAELGPATDIWAVGATLLEALTGRQAFPADGTFRQRHVDAPELPSKTPPVLADAIRACLRRSPAERPAAAELDALLEPLDEWAERGLRRIR